MKYFIFLSFIFMSLWTLGQGQLRVTFFLSSSCRVCQYYTLPMRDLFRDFSGVDVEFVGMFPGHLESDSTISHFKEKYLIPFSLRKDSLEHLRLGASITPEVAVELNGKLIYLGRIDNSFESVGKKRAVVNSYELKNVLTDVAKGGVPVFQSVPAIGCIIEK